MHLHVDRIALVEPDDLRAFDVVPLGRRRPEDALAQLVGGTTREVAFSGA